MEPSSADKGFFQQPPELQNQFHDDISFKRVTKLFLPAAVAQLAEPELAQLGEKVLDDQIFRWISDAERNQPYLRGNGRDAFGKPRNELVTTEGWRNLQEFGIMKGMVAFNYDTDYGQFTRLVQHLRLHLWHPSAANVTCPSAMHDGAARLLQMHLAGEQLDPVHRKVFQNAFDHLTSRDPRKAWTSGQWMTERPGGSDVSRTETVARYQPLPSSSPLANPAENIPLGPWDINGFKWFSSASDSSMAVLLAQTKPGKGLSAFYAPMRRHSPSSTTTTGKPAKEATELNGVRITRLKNKLGTQSLPTAELELAGMRGWLIGEEGRGIQEIATILTITRVHSTIAALGYVGRGLAVARAYALVREVGGGKGKRVRLCRTPLHMRTLATMTGEYHGLMLLTFYTIYLLGVDERGTGLPARGAPDNEAGSRSPQVVHRLTPPSQHVAPLLRVLSSLHKSYCCKRAMPLLFSCMEALGGVGYLLNAETEPLNVARLFRDGCVLPIWEGTTDVLATDTVRALKHGATGKQCIDALEWFVGAAETAIRVTRAKAGARNALQAVRKAWEAVKAHLQRQSAEELLPDAREIVWRIAEILIALLLAIDAASDEAPEAEIMRQRVFSTNGFISENGKDLEGPTEDLDADCRIVYGGKGPSDGKVMVSRL